MKKIALVTLSYNSHLDIVRLSESLSMYNKNLYDLIIIDNASTDRVGCEILKNLCLEKDYVFLQSEENKGFATGTNIGIQYALDHEYQNIGLINPDCVFVQQDFFNHLDTALDTCDIITPLITYYPDVDTIYSAGGSVSSLTMMTSMHGKGEKDFSKYEKQLLCEFATGCALFAKRKVFEKVGLLPTEYFLYFEEADWCMRAKSFGFKMCYVPSVRISHGVSTSIGYLSKIYVYYMIRNYPIFAKKYIKWYNLFIFYPFYILVWCGGYTFLVIKNGKPELIKYIVKGLFNLKI